MLDSVLLEGIVWYIDSGRDSWRSKKENISRYLRVLFCKNAILLILQQQ